MLHDPCSLISGIAASMSCFLAFIGSIGCYASKVGFVRLVWVYLGAIVADALDGDPGHTHMQRLLLLISESKPEVI